MLNLARQFPFYILVIMAFSMTMIFAGFVSLSVELHSLKQAFWRWGVISFVIAGVIGVLSIGRENQGSFRENLVSIAVVYLVVPVILAAPLIDAVPSIGVETSIYEMLASLTTTGSVALTQTSGAFYPILFYKAMISWCGAFFILIVAFAVFEPRQVGGFEIVPDSVIASGARATGGRRGRANRFSYYVLRFAPPYLIITGILVFCLLLAGHSVENAFLLAWATISTSGISAEIASEAGVNIWLSEIMMGGVLAMMLFRGLWSNVGIGIWPTQIQKDPEVRTAITILAAILIYFFALEFFYEITNFHRANLIILVRDIWGTFYTALSYLATHGAISEFWIINVETTGVYLPAMTLLSLAIIGGGVATTSGGIKLLRIYALYSLSRREVSRLIDPHAIAASGPAGRRLRRTGGVNALVFFMLTLALIATSILAFAFMGIDFSEAVVLAVMSATNCGPVIDLFPIYFGALDDMPRAFYIVSGLVMIIGRVEVLVFIALLNREFWLDG